MEKLEVTWKRAIKVWWALFWRGVLYTLLISIPVGVVLGIVAALLGEGEHVRTYGNLIGLFIGIPIGIWVVRIILDKQFSDFRIVLIPSNRAILDQAAERAEQYPAAAESET